MHMANIYIVRKHEDIVPHVLFSHVLNGCDTISSSYGVLKVKTVKALETVTFHHNWVITR